jgi:coenzyme PQQ biosynthesis protein PqqD
MTTEIRAHVFDAPRRRERVLTQEAEDELVLLDLDAGTYFALNEVGARVWELCDGEHGLAEIVSSIEAEFEAPRGVIEKDVRALLDELETDHLVAY